MSATTPAGAPAETTPRLVRTWVPIVVGALVAYIGGIDVVANVVQAFNIDVNQAATGFEVFATGLLSGLYYTVATFLETKVKPQFGWLLGLAKLPVYVEARDAVAKRFDRGDAGQTSNTVIFVLAIVGVVLLVLLLVGVL